MLMIRADDGSEERRHLDTRILVGFGRPLAQLINAAMNVGVFGLVEADDAVDHGARLLGGGGVVEVDQRLAVHLVVQDREIVVNFADVEHEVASSCQLRVVSCQ